ncbi:hypothetical protein [Agarilytica rhodophyticola]|uniref:hypothetical protein n=1 Tax=Agarilytica rhodophyticola TaxID=1737490 RepID=UPI000B342D6B|nr:hypothetical protein [Agarilytica rhodophyticola]
MTSNVYDMYGFKFDDINTAKSFIDEALNIEMVAHESGYHCGDYFRFGDVGKEHFILQRNFDDFEQEWTEESYSKYPLLFYVNETKRNESISKLLLLNERVSLLKHEIID